MRGPLLAGVLLGVLLVAGCGGEATERPRQGAGTPPVAGTGVPVAAAPRTRASRGRQDAYEVRVGGVTDGGRIEGVITLSAVPFIHTIVIDKDVQACGRESHPSERCVFDAETLGLADCVVTLEGIRVGKAWPPEMAADDRTATIVQVSCRYRPHVMVVRAGTRILVENLDDALHHIHVVRTDVPMLSTQWGFGHGRGQLPEQVLAKPGTYSVRCDLHPWMNGSIQVVTHPYVAVTDRQGRFAIEDVPAGAYTLKAWHEGMQETPVISDNKISGYNYGPDWVETVPITVEAGRTASVSLVAPAPTE